MNSIMANTSNNGSLILILPVIVPQSNFNGRIPANDNCIKKETNTSSTEYMSVMNGSQIEGNLVDIKQEADTNKIEVDVNPDIVIKREVEQCKQEILEEENNPPAKRRGALRGETVASYPSTRHASITANTTLQNPPGIYTLCIPIRHKSPTPEEKISAVVNGTYFKTILPDEFEHRICSYQKVTDGENFKATIRIKAGSEEEVERWIFAFENKSLTDWRIERTYPHSGLKNLYKVDLRCQHNTRPRSKETPKEAKNRASKNTDCPATITIIVKKTKFSRNRRSRSKDSHYIEEGFSTLITLKFVHNHPLNCADTLKYRRVTKATVRKLEDLFTNGHSPRSALDILQHELQEEYGERYLEASVDRAINPDIHFCNRLYRTMFRKDYDAPKGE
ncbi:uncharacterized protein LOC121859534 [Homarus americanus]|uniref:Uncharacterized protein n=1 Tax=Homarus americanus TaxID=6706 RepID=A0A8J5N7B0_HOMAM|nr:uncharacterized protein LOC121859534 [Homarus americanus]KAG7174424.1 hypothetical protein Hamer_G003367 [Homarus americanus]